MGSSSDVVDQTSTSTTSVQLNRDAITESGTQILDSIIVDMSDAALRDLVGGFRASFEVLVSQQRAGVGDIIALGQSVLDLADRNQIQLAGMAQNTLRTSLEWMRQQQQMGRYVIDFSAKAVSESYDFATMALARNASALDRALDITAEVKTGDLKDMFQGLSISVLLFSVAAIYLVTKKGR